MNPVKNVYIVDDDEGIREILTSMLEEEEYRVRAFEKGYDAVIKMKSNHPSMILLDYYLPGENAESIILAVKRIKGDIPIVLMSANLTLSSDLEKIGASEFIKKPFTRDTLLQVVTKYVY